MIIAPRVLSGDVSKMDLARMIFCEPELKPLSELTQAQIAKLLGCSVTIISRAQQEVHSECQCGPWVSNATEMLNDKTRWAVSLTDMSHPIELIGKQVLVKNMIVTVW